MIDINVFQDALERYNQKNKFLIDKWSRALVDVNKDIDELYTCKPSSERDWCIRAKELVRTEIEIFLHDLQMAPDMFFTNEEFADPFGVKLQTDLFVQER